MSIDDLIADVIKGSDIESGTDLYEQIESGLTAIGLNLAFFVFETSEHSSCARTLNGVTASYPALTLYLKYDSDFKQTGIDPHSGNWNDKWSQTDAVRSVLNTALQKSGFDEDYVSDRTFIFVRTLEEIAFHQLGHQCADEVRQMVIKQAPGVHVDRVYWNGREYYVLMRDKSDYKRVKRSVKSYMMKAIPKLLSMADKEGCCQDYKASIEFGFAGHVPLHFLR